MSTQQHHTQGPFDPDDPLTGMGIAMVGMALQEMAEQEQREQPAPRERTSKDLSSSYLFIIGVITILAIMFLCGILASISGS